jgi:hypothetical protein
MSDNEPDSITFGSLSDGTVLFAKKELPYGYKLFRMVPGATYPFQVQTGSYLAAVQSTAQRMISEDQQQVQENARSEVQRLANRTAKKAAKRPKPKGQEFRNFKRGVLIIAVIAIVVLLRLLIASP